MNCIKTKMYVIFLLTNLFTFNSFSQSIPKKINEKDPNLPHWVKLMYAFRPNVFEVEKAFKATQKWEEEGEESSIYMGIYRRWLRAVKNYVNDSGFVNFPTQEELRLKEQIHLTNQQTSNSVWSFAGPERHIKAKYNTNDTSVLRSWHANVYCIDQSLSNPLVLYCGGESGGIYKSINKGLQWIYVSPNNLFTSVRSIQIHPSNPDIVICGAANKLYRTMDGGQTWNAIGQTSFQSLNLEANQIIFNSTNPNIVFAATDQGLFRSTDMGINWVEILNEDCLSVVFNATNQQIVYATQHNPTTGGSNFYKSIDGGLTFSIRENGWFQVPSVDVGLIDSRGGKIAVTEANPNKIYVLLVGESSSTAQLQTHGFIGIYVSSDGGETWSNPHAIIGAPYNGNSHPNPMTFSGDNNSYNQIYYNTTIIASHLNENNILFGGLSLWRSNNSAESFSPVGGYVGNVPEIHPDMQTLINRKISSNSEEVWLSCDGGINYSLDWFASHDSKTVGIWGSDFWGFDQGWNEDIMVGGRYHNGNAAYHEDYLPGDFIQLGGGEAPTGYVNYSNERKTYFSDIGGKKIPNSISGLVEEFSVGSFPNESYWFNSSSRIIFDHRYWNVAYMGKENKFYKSTDGGTSFGPIAALNSNADNLVLWIEQSRANPNVFFAQVVVGNFSQLKKSIDNGITWTNVSIPQTNRRNLFFCLSGSNENELWIGYTDGANGSKVYRSVNGGQSFANITTSVLNGYKIYGMCHQMGTNGGVYLAMKDGAVFYRSNSMVNWVNYSAGLPVITNPINVLPFYKQGKLRLANASIGIWEAPFYESSNLIADFSADYSTYYCPGETVNFVDHSVVGDSAQYLWSFPGGTPSSSTEKYPSIVYNGIGIYDVSLIVIENGISDTIVKNAFISTQGIDNLPLIQDFESSGLPDTWKLYDDQENSVTWGFCNYTSAYGIGENCMYFDNWYINAQGARDAIWTGKYNFTNTVNPYLKFDVAYCRYDNNWTDTLVIKASNDCGNTFEIVYLRGGDDLATAPPNNSSHFDAPANEWRTDSVSLLDLVGYENAIISFENRGHYGQPIYIDNINIDNDASVNIVQNPVMKGIKVSPNPANNFLQIDLDAIEQISSIQLYNSNGNLIRNIEITEQNNSIKINISDLSSGMYYAKVIAGNLVKTKKFIVQK